MTTPDHPDTAEVYLTNATSVSTGETGPGYTSLPWPEAKALVDQGLAVYGTSPPPNMLRAAHPVSPP
jgi:hypothetical protein